MTAPDMTARLQAIGAPWACFLDAHLWPLPETVDGRPALVYGTGYGSWGAWAQINAALYAAAAARWEDALFAGAPERFRNQDARRETALALLRYALAFHTTGGHAGAGNVPWGGQPENPDTDVNWKLGFNNWHSPLWVAFLAEAVFELGSSVPEALQHRFERAVVHDADVQCMLPLRSFDGTAEEAGRKHSRPESNAWKASLLTLARGLLPDHPHAGRWREREERLWASSFATPEDGRSDTRLGGRPLRELVIGSHLTPANVVIHHGFLHPCYMVFPLLSRMQAARFCARFGVDYPEAAAHREAAVMARLEQFILPGRLFYPAGKDWPRWVYGQAYLLPLLAHRTIADGAGYGDAIADLVRTRQRDAAESPDGSLILHRSPLLLERQAWDAHRYESDMAASLVQTLRIMEERAGGGRRPPQPQEAAAPLYSEPLAKTVVLRRPQAIFAASGRAYDGPVQITLTSAANPHLLEWRGNGSLRFDLLGLPRARNEMHLVDHALREEDDGFSAHFRVQGGATTFNGPVLQGDILARVMPGRDALYVYQRVTAMGHGEVACVDLHTWRLAQEIHNANMRRLSGGMTEQDVPARTLVDAVWPHELLSIDNSFHLRLEKGASWSLAQPATRQDDTKGMSWLEVFRRADLPSPLRVAPEQHIAEAGLTASIEDIPGPFTIKSENGKACFVFARGQVMIPALLPDT